MQQIKCIIMCSKSLPWPYALICAVNCAMNFVSGTQALDHDPKNVNYDHST